ECKLFGRDAVPGGDQVIDLAGAVAGATNVEADLRGLDAADIFDAAVLLHVGDLGFDGALAGARRADSHRSGHLSNELAWGQRVIGGSRLRRPDAFVIELVALRWRHHEPPGNDRGRDTSLSRQA